MDIEPTRRHHGAARRRPRKPGQPKKSRRPAPPMMFSSTPKRQNLVAPPRDRDGPILFRNPAYRAGRESQENARGINNNRPGLSLRAVEKFSGAKVAPNWVVRKGSSPQVKNPKFESAGVVAAPNDPSTRMSVMDLVEATLSPHLRPEKPKRAEDRAASIIPEELKGRRRGVQPRGFLAAVSREQRGPVRMVPSEAAAFGSANKENVPPPLRYPNLRGHHCSIDDELTDEDQAYYNDDNGAKFEVAAAVGARSTSSQEESEEAHSDRNYRPRPCPAAAAAAAVRVESNEEEGLEIGISGRHNISLTRYYSATVTAEVVAAPSVPRTLASSSPRAVEKYGGAIVAPNWVVREEGSPQVKNPKFDRAGAVGTGSNPNHPSTKRSVMERFIFGGPEETVTTAAAAGAAAEWVPNSLEDFAGGAAAAAFGNDALFKFTY